MDPSIVNKLVRGKPYPVRFVHKPTDGLYDQGNYVVADYDAAGALITHTIGGQVLMAFVPWTNIISIDLTS